MAQLCQGPSLGPSWLLFPIQVRAHSKQRLTRAEDSITTQASSPRSPPDPPRILPAATQPTPLRSSEQPAPSTVRQRVAGIARLPWERAREGGPYLPRHSRGSTQLRLLRLGYSPASRARLEYIPSSEGPGRRGGPRAAAEGSAGPGHPAPLAGVSGCGPGAERKPAGPTRQPPSAAKGAGAGHRKAEPLYVTQTLAQ